MNVQWSQLWIAKSVGSCLIRRWKAWINDSATRPSFHTFLCTWILCASAIKVRDWSTDISTHYAFYATYYTQHVCKIQDRGSTDEGWSPAWEEIGEREGEAKKEWRVVKIRNKGYEYGRHGINITFHNAILAQWWSKSKRNAPNSGI